MSDIPFWGFLIVLDIFYWFLTGPIVLILIVLGCYGSQWLGRGRWLAFGAAVLLAAPLALAAVNLTYDQYALQLTLESDETIAGVPLYAGSKVWFYDRDHQVFRAVELRRVTNIVGVPFIGSAMRDGFGSWEGTLAADLTISGWPCRRGRIGIERDGRQWFCELAIAHSFFDYDLPAGTSVSDAGSNSWCLSLPRDTGVVIKALFTTAPPGIALTVTTEGRLKSISGGSGHPIFVRGVPLKLPIDVSEVAALGKLAQPFAIAGEQRPAGTAVRIDLVAGAVSLAPQR